MPIKFQFFCQLVLQVHKPFKYFRYGFLQLSAFFMRPLKVHSKIYLFPLHKNLIQINPSLQIPFIIIIIINLMKIILFLPFIFYLQTSMKKYQNWLDCQLYNNHLQNLVHIKKRKQTNFHLRCKTSYPKHSSHHGFTIYQNQQKSKKLKHSQSLCKSFFINKENIQYAKRIKNAPSVISRQKLEKEYERNHWWVKKKSKVINCCTQKRQKNVRNFFKISEDKHRKGYHKYSLKFNILSLPKLPTNQFGSYWFQIVTYEEKASSDHFTADQIVDKQVQVLLRFKPKNTAVKLKIHYSKGLEYVSGGEYTFPFPNVDEEKQYLLKSQKDLRKKVQFYLIFSTLKQDNQYSFF